MDLIITEKQITAKRIAQILSGGKMKTRKVGSIPVFEFDDRMVMGLKGHIVGIDFPPEFNRWTFELQELIRASPMRVPLQKEYVSALRKLGEETDRVVVATDFDREGELIGVEALQIVKEANPQIRIHRARYSALTSPEIQKAFDRPAEVDYNLASACEARQEIDLVWGAALTRFVSLASGKLGSDFLSVGRVQSPTLALLVEREKEIEKFKPETYWEIEADLGDFTARHQKGRFSDKAEAEGALARMGRQATVSKIRVADRRDSPPTPFNTTEFLRSATAMGYSAASAMRIAETLYMNGLISYPRTDNTVFSPMDFRAHLEMFQGTPYGDLARKLIEQGRLTPSRGKKEATDHPPIYPVSVPPGPLPREQQRIYELVVRRFLACFAPPTLWKKTDVDLSIGGEPFEATGVTIVSPGWREYYPYRPLEEKSLPPLKEGDTLAVRGARMDEKQTKPPPRYSQGQLIKKMEDMGLGTKSTRHETLAKLLDRAYVRGRQLQPSKKAYAVIESLQTYASGITQPEMTRVLEEDMDKIAAGQKTEAEVVEESRQMLATIFKDLLRDRKAIGAELKQRIREDEAVGPCPKCGAQLLVRRSKKGGRFIGCGAYPKCSYSLPLPRMGFLNITQEKCATHQLAHLQIVTRGRKPWALGCPQCNYDNWKARQAASTALKPDASSPDAPAAKAAGALAPAPAPSPVRDEPQEPEAEEPPE
ncbi:MAG: DNA topoisomerase I [Euryarchaeota archaeon]|nr:DNA topoisomerase I [Euryarchaeota archaeon]